MNNADIERRLNALIEHLGLETKEEKCPACRGTGAENYPPIGGWKPCPECGGWRNTISFVPIKKDEEP